MELRILRGHEIKEAIKGIDDQIALDLLLDSYQKNLFFIGAFENDLIGAIGISHFQEIAYLWVEKNDHQKEIASKLIRMSLTLTQDDLYVSFSTQWDDVYEDL